MTILNGVQLVCTILNAGLVLLVRDRLRLNAPRVRIALGGVGVLLATFGFTTLMVLLPGPWEGEFSAIVDATATAACYLTEGLLVLSLLEIVGGSMQTSKRRRYYRQSGA